MHVYVYGIAAIAAAHQLHEALNQSITDVKYLIDQTKELSSFTATRQDTEACIQPVATSCWFDQFLDMHVW